MSFYISGPMRGYPEFNFPMFDKAEEWLKSTVGITKVYSPASRDREAFNFDPTGLKGTEAELKACGFDLDKAKRDDAKLISNATDILMLPGWSRSEGAKAEKVLAEWLGVRVSYLRFDPDGRWYLYVTPEPTDMDYVPDGPCERHPSSQRLHDLLAEMGELHDRKQADYGSSTDPFANVRASEDFGIPAWVGALVRMNDKMQRLKAAAKGSTLKNEGVADSFMDLAVYALIGLVLHEEGQS